MLHRPFRLLCGTFAILAIVLAASHPPTRLQAQQPTPAPAQPLTGQRNPESIPAVLSATALTFMPNAGQRDAAVRFEAQTGSASLTFSANHVTFALPVPQPQDDPRSSSRMILPPSLVRLHFRGANPNPTIAGSDPTGGTVNIMVGNKPRDWKLNLTAYQRLTYQQLYPGIDLVYEGADGRLKGTYTVAGGIDPALIRWRYEGAQQVEVDATTGDLHITPQARGDGLAPTTMVERAPIAWQERDGQREPVAAQYAVEADGTVRFVLGAYDHTRPLIIDPTVTYLAQGLTSSPYGADVAVGPDGSIYVGTIIHRSSTGLDLSIARFGPEGGAPLSQSIVGGSSIDQFIYLTTDGAGKLYVAANSTSSDLPTTSNRLHGKNNECTGCSDAFMMRLASDLSFEYGTYIGGNSDDDIYDIAVAHDGTVALVGATYSEAFTAGLPSANAYDSVIYDGRNDGFLLKLTPAGSGYTTNYGTFLGDDSAASGSGVVFDSDKNIYITGTTSPFFIEGASAGDLLAMKFSPTNGLVYRQIYGSQGYQGYEDGIAITLDPEGNAAILGQSDVEGVETTFVAYLGADGTIVRQVTISAQDRYLEGALAIDANGVLYAGTNLDSGFVTIVDPDDASSETVTLPAPVDALTLDADGNVYVIGSDSTDSYLAKIGGRSGPIRVSITDADGKPVQALKANAEGWPVLNAAGGAIANPLTVKVTVEAATQADTLLDLFPNTGTNLRFYVEAAPKECSPRVTNRHPTNTFSFYEYSDLCAATSNPGQTRTLTWKVWVQPSQAAKLLVRAWLVPTSPEQSPVSQLRQVDIPKTSITKPLVFIPGVTGSFLDDRTGGATSISNLWPGARLLTQYLRLSLYPSDFQPEVVATDALRKVATENIYGSFLERLQQLGYTEYQVAGRPERRTVAGCDQSQSSAQPRLFVFAYDWRRANQDHVPLLDEYIRCARSVIGQSNAQVDLVAHSMGGLLSRSYILSKPGVVSRATTIGTPWLGSVKTLKILHDGQYFESGASAYVLATAADIQYIVGSFPSIGQLLPSPNYYGIRSKAPLPIKEGDFDWNGNGQPEESYTTYAMQQALVDAYFGRRQISLGTINKTFYDSRTSWGAQDDWRDDRTGVQYYQIYGKQDVDDTVAQVQSMRVWVRNGNNRVLTNKLKPLPGPGDGTVPLLSAERYGSSDLAPNVLRYQVRTGDKSHVGMLANPEVQQEVTRFLTGQAINPSYPTSRQ
ncbi:MAG TPA: hypothetical protein VFS21_02715 [Roseiflexaceae bacterium]|nr:hypothetical protein [Roseiflexaceae bacterium]